MFRCLFTLIALSLPLNAYSQERPPTFVDAASVVPGLLTEMRYLGAHNFVGAPVDGYEKPICYLTQQAAQGLARVAVELSSHSLVLKAFDCYRPARAVAHFVRWAQNIADVKRKTEFYPDVDKRNLFRDGYIAARSGHSRGSTVDITLARRDGGRELDMGTPFDFFSPRSAPGDRTVSVEAQRNRALLAQAMRNGGFVPYDKEWWHFTLRNEPFRDTYFNFPVR